MLSHPVFAPRRSLARRLAATAVALVAVGCGPGPAPDDAGADGVGSAVDPRGTDGTFSFSWLINGSAPTAAVNACQAANVRFIRMVVVDADNSQRRFDEFRFDCNLGSYRSARPELRAGTYRVFWEAAAADGRVLSLASGTLVNGVPQPVPEQIVVRTGTFLDFDEVNRPSTMFRGAPTNFATGAGPLNVAISWAPTVGATAGVDCASAGVATLSWTLRMSNNYPSDEHTERTACTAATARIAWDRRNWDNYSLEVQGYDAAGALRWSSRCADLLLNTPTAPPNLTCVVDRRP